MSEAKGIGEILGGLALAAAAGLLNGSWNAAFNPKLALAVGPKSTVQTVQLGRQRTVLRSLSIALSSLHLNTEIKYDLDYHYAWAIFQLYSGIVNCFVSLLWAGGPANVSYIVSQLPTTTIVLLVLFAILWGCSLILFGVGCKVAGVGLGTSLRIGILLIIGTFLPLLYYRRIITATGGVIMAGLAIVCVGLYFSAESLRIRDIDIKKLHEEQTTIEGKASLEEKNESSGKTCIDQLSDSESQRRRNTATSTGFPSESTSEEEVLVQEEYSTLFKVSVCLLGGILASLFQFAFIFGQDIINVAKNDAHTPIGGSAAIIWLFTLTIGCIPSIVYGFYSSPKGIPLKTIWRCPWWRHFIILITSITYVAPTHMYGVAASVLLPKSFAASIAWPIFMTTTVAQGMILSVLLGEWNAASPAAISYLKAGLFLSTVGVIVFMASVAI
jgi:hypothetical protein